MRNGQGARVAVAGVIALGAAIRLLGLSRFPDGLWHDEALNGLQVARLLEGRLSFVFMDISPREPLWFYLAAPCLAAARWLGEGSLASDIAGLRVASALIGTATLGAFWLLARRTMPVAWALVALAMLAVLPWHVHFSRLAFRAILLPLLVCLSGWALLRWERTGRPRDAALASGFALAGVYSYHAGPVLPLALLLAMGARCVQSRGTEALRGRVKGLAIAAAIAAVGSVPIAAALVAGPVDATMRFREVAAAEAADSTIVGNIARVAAFFFVLGDGDFRHGPAGRPLLPLALGPVLLAGVAASLAMLLRGRGGKRALDAWLLATLAGFMAVSALSSEAPHKLRMLGMAPVVVLLFVEGLRVAFVWLRRRGAGARVLRVGLAVVLLATLALEARAVVKWSRDYREFEYFSGGQTRVAEWSRGLDVDGDARNRPRPEGMALWLPRGLAEDPVIRYLARDVRSFERLEEAVVADPPAAVAIVVTGQAPRNGPMLERLFPRASYISLIVNPGNDGVWGVVYVVPQRASALSPAEALIAAQFETHHRYHEVKE